MHQAKPMPLQSGMDWTQLLQVTYSGVYVHTHILTRTDSCTHNSWFRLIHMLYTLLCYPKEWTAYITCLVWDNAMYYVPTVARCTDFSTCYLSLSEWKMLWPIINILIKMIWQKPSNIMDLSWGVFWKRYVSRSNQPLWLQCFPSEARVPRRGLAAGYFVRLLLIDQTCYVRNKPQRAVPLLGNNVRRGWWCSCSQAEVEVQCIHKVFRPRHFFSHFMLQPFAKIFSIIICSLINLHSIPHDDKAKTEF